MSKVVFNLIEQGAIEIQSYFHEGKLANFVPFNRAGQQLEHHIGTRHRISSFQQTIIKNCNEQVIFH